MRPVWVLLILGLKDLGLLICHFEASLLLLPDWWVSFGSQDLVNHHVQVHTIGVVGRAWEKRTAAVRANLVGFKWWSGAVFANVNLIDFDLDIIVSLSFLWHVIYELILSVFLWSSQHVRGLIQVNLANDFIVCKRHVEARLDEKAHLCSAQLYFLLRNSAKICMASTRNKVQEFFSAFLLHLLFLDLLV